MRRYEIILPLERLEFVAHNYQEASYLFEAVKKGARLILLGDGRARVSPFKLAPAPSRTPAKLNDLGVIRDDE